MPQHAQLHRGACSLGGGAALSEYSRGAVDSLTDLILLMPGQPTFTGHTAVCVCAANIQKSSAHTHRTFMSPDSAPETYLRLFYSPPRKSDFTLKPRQTKISKY